MPPTLEHAYVLLEPPSPPPVAVSPDAQGTADGAADGEAADDVTSDEGDGDATAHEAAQEAAAAEDARLLDSLWCSMQRVAPAPAIVFSGVWLHSPRPARDPALSTASYRRSARRGTALGISSAP